MMAPASDRHARVASEGGSVAQLFEVSLSASYVAVVGKQHSTEPEDRKLNQRSN
jgi:hypothetical protein